MALPAPSATSTCVVTGSSSGIGLEIARVLAKKGHGVTLVARREDRLKEVADELSTAHGVRAEVVALDLTDPEARAELLGTLEERGLVAEVLVNNAGFGTTGRVSSIAVDKEMAMVRTNVEALVDLTTRFLADMAQRKRGGVLNVASTAAFQPLPGQAGYAATKAFVVSYSQAVAAEVKRDGITVTTLCPGPVKTEFGDVAGFSAKEMGLPGWMWVPAEEVARQAVEGLADGKLLVIPGTFNKVTSMAGVHTPRRPLLSVLSRIHPALKR